MHVVYNLPQLHTQSVTPCRRTLRVVRPSPWGPRSCPKLGGRPGSPAPSYRSDAAALRGRSRSRSTALPSRTPFGCPRVWRASVSRRASRLPPFRELSRGVDTSRTTSRPRASGRSSASLATVALVPRVRAGFCRLSWPAKFNSWEPRARIPDELINEYEEQCARPAERARRSGRLPAGARGRRRARAGLPTGAHVEGTRPVPHRADGSGGGVRLPGGPRRRRSVQARGDREGRGRGRAQRDRRRAATLPAPTPPTAGGSEELEQHDMISAIEATKCGRLTIDSFPV